MATELDLSILEEDVREQIEELLKLAADDGKTTTFDMACIQSLSNFPREEQLEILKSYRATPITKINNMAAYLQTVINRFRRTEQQRKRGAFEGLPHGVDVKLTQMISSKLLKVEDLDEAVIKVLGMVNEDVALNALDNFEGALRSKSIRNHSAQLMSQIKRAREMGGPPPHFQGQGPVVNIQPPPMMQPRPMQPMQVAQVPGMPAQGLMKMGPQNGAMQPMQAIGMGPPPQQASVPAVPPKHLLQSIPLKDYTQEHIATNIQTQEVHNLSSFAKFVHPVVVHKLVLEWENCLTLIVILDDECWEILAKLEYPLGLAVVYEVADIMRVKQANFVDILKRFKAIAARYFSQPFLKQGPGGPPGPLGPNLPPNMPPDNMHSNHSTMTVAAMPMQPQFVVQVNRPGQHFNGNQHSGRAPHLAGMVRDAIDRLVQANSMYLSWEDFDEELLRQIERLGPDRAARWARSVGERDLSNVKKMTNYLMSTVKKAANYN